MKFSAGVKKLCLLAVVLTVGLSSVHAQPPAAAKPQVKYVFLMIGDGMGSGQREVAEMYKRTKAGVKPGDKAGMLLMNQFPIKGLTTTHPKIGFVTDSAAAGTALACGEKTLNGVISMKVDRKTKLRSFAYDVKDNGKKVGIISTAPLDHATPAAFYACQPHRSQAYGIASQAAGSGFNYFAGTPFAGNAKHKVKGRVSPVDRAKKAGYTMHSGVAGRKNIKAGDDKIIWQTNVPYGAKVPAAQVSLADLVAKGIEVLDNDKGFFMMVEGARIDWMGHNNDLAGNIGETLAFDDAIKVAYDFYLKYPEETLIVVTADHETGGLKTFFGEGFSPEKFVKTVDAQKISGKALFKKIKAWKKSKASEEDVYNQIVALLPVDDLTDKEKGQLKQSITYTLYPEKMTKADKAKLDKKNRLANICNAIVASRSGVAWSTFGHTGAPVPTTAIGAGAKRFEGKTDNTEIAKKLKVILTK